ncbi:MAG: HD-GYP domain-containing protein [Candidatus Omnitrophota bacterium]|nr:MAG: HD-GYP domain-containing protein [Candidatus Omnitrophota bacterium]
MKIDYRRQLEKAARQMILIHRASTLIKLILRTILRNIKVTHAGLLIYDKRRDEYVARISRGHSGLRIPPGFVKVKRNNPLIRYFTDEKLKFPKESILWEKTTSLLKSVKVKKAPELKKFLEEVKYTLSLYQAKACIPGFFRDDLIGILFLGEKKNKKRFLEEELGFLAVLASDVVMALKNAWLIEDLNQQVEINKRLFLQTVAALASSIEAKDKYTRGHTDRVVKHSLAIAYNLKKHRKVKNWDVFVENLKVAALLHDIGKIGIPEEILNKNAPLSEEERKVIETHSSIGANILNHIEEFHDALLGVKHHHERYDGSGYPSKLKGNQIPLIASIIALADAFDAMIMDRPYRKGFPPQEAIKEIERNRGRQFAPVVVDAFLESQKKIIDLAI